MKPLIALVAVALSLSVVSSSLGKEREDVRKTVSCSEASTAKLKLSDEDGRVEVEFEVDQNRNGVRWQVVLRQNGAVVFSGQRTTKAPSGSFEVRRVLGNMIGTDRIVARATRASGEACRVTASF